MTNAQVAASWDRGEKARSNHMSTNGIDIYSYGLRIGLTTTDGGKVAIRYTSPHNFRSVTTSHHVGLVMQYADYAVDPMTPYSTFE